MSSYQPPSGAGTPQSFPEVPPTGDLGGHRVGIAFALGDLTANIRSLSDIVRDQNSKLDKLDTKITEGLKSQGDAIQAIRDELLVAKTQLNSAYLTSKWVFAVVAGILGWAAGHWSWLNRIIG